jgi:ADP-ribosylglycohydrolase
MDQRADRIMGSLFGAAYGDAMGRPTEFMTMNQIAKMYGKPGPRDLPTPALVTDDTQMMIAVARAAANMGRQYASQADWELQLGGEFLNWYDDPASSEPGRAPGGTCLASLSKYRAGMPWRLATDPDGKGCGANMRVTPLGLINCDMPTMIEVAQLQAAWTHGHPTALVASSLTAMATRFLLDGGAIKDLKATLWQAANGVWYSPWLGGQLRGRWIGDADMQQGIDECRQVLAKVSKPGDGWGTDPCEKTGAGWVAEEALATAVECCVRFPDHPVMALRRAAATSGDSDSIACLVGAFMGARYGIDAFPTEWRNRIEYGGELASLALRLAR